MINLVFERGVVAGPCCTCGAPGSRVLSEATGNELAVICSTCWDASLSGFNDLQAHEAELLEQGVHPKMVKRIMSVWAEKV